MANAFEYSRRIEFRETDMAGIVHFANYFGYMEEAEHAFLRAIGLGVHTQVDGQTVSWPRVAADCDFRNPIKFEDELTIRVGVTRIGSKSVTYLHEMFCDEVLVAEGSVTAVCCKIVAGQKPESIPIPDEFVSSLQPFLIEQE